MEAVLFNFNDLALLLVIAECLLLSAMLLLHAKGLPSRRLLSLVFACFAVDCISKLAYWCLPLKALAPELMTQLFLWGKWAYVILGPAIYFYARSLLGTRLYVSKLLLHASLVMVYPMLLCLYFGTATTAQFEAAAEDYSAFLSSTMYQLTNWYAAILPLIYSVLALHLYVRYRNDLEQKFSNLSTVEKRWVRLMLCGFVVMTCWHIIGIALAAETGRLAHWIALTGNYGRFVFANILVFLTLADSFEVRKAADTSHVEVEKPQQLELETLTQHITKTVEDKQLYLSPDLTLEELATQLKVPSRLLSEATNSQLNVNFFEFINGFRVEHAKHLLKTHPKMSVQKVMEDAGFSSKSAFHRFFKKHTGLSPTQYRQQGD